MRRIFLSLGSSRVRLGLGLLLACLLMTQIVSTFTGNRLTASTPSMPLTDVRTGGTSRLEQLAKTDHIALLKLCLAHYNRTYTDYTCVLTKQERLGGSMSEVQVIDIKFKDSPFFSVLMSWRVNAPRGDRMLYVENDPNGRHKMYIHPTGLAGRFVPVVERNPDDPEVLKSSLRSIKEFSFGRGIQALIAVYTEAKSRGHLIEESYLGTGQVDNRPTYVLKRVLRAVPGINYPAYVTIIEIDQEYLVPVHVKGIDWQERPLCDYAYSNLRFNVGLKDAEFSRKANNL